MPAILLVTFSIYLPSLRNGWVLDDRHEFIDNKLIHSWSFLWNSFRYDLWWFRDPRACRKVRTTGRSRMYGSRVNAFLFGTNPALWHLAKIALNVVVVALSFRVAQLLTRNVTIALLTAAIFGDVAGQCGRRCVRQRDSPAVVDGVRTGRDDLPDSAQARFVSRIDRRRDPLCVRSADA